MTEHERPQQPPGDRPEGVTAPGVTAAEQRAGESPDTKLAREEPETEAAGLSAEEEAVRRGVPAD